MAILLLLICCLAGSLEAQVGTEDSLVIATVIAELDSTPNNVVSANTMMLDGTSMEALSSDATAGLLVAIKTNSLTWQHTVQHETYPKVFGVYLKMDERTSLFILLDFEEPSRPIRVIAPFPNGIDAPPNLGMFEFGER